MQKFLFPDKEELPNDFEMPIWDHLEELRERVLVALLACGVAILGCFCFSKELVLFLEAPVAGAGVRFLQLSPGEFFFTTLKVCLRDFCCSVPCPSLAVPLCESLWGARALSCVILYCDHDSLDSSIRLLSLTSLPWLSLHLLCSTVLHRDYSG